jgi:hypothetical protein
MHTFKGPFFVRVQILAFERVVVAGVVAAAETWQIWLISEDKSTSRQIFF